MPAVAPSSPENNIFLEGPPIESSGNSSPVLLVHVCIGLAVIALLIVFHLAARSDPTLKSTRSSETGAMEEKPATVDFSFAEQQRLYHQFSGAHHEAGDTSHGLSSAMTQGTTGRPGSSQARSTEGTAGTSAPEKDSASGNAWDRGKVVAGVFDVAPSKMIMSRPPPPPPLTPPELSTTIFTFDGHKYSHSRSSPELDTSFFQQPNPDYMSSAFASQPVGSATATQSPVTPRRRSYTKTIPIDAPARPTSSPRTPLDLSSSYPPTSFMLPGPPPHHGAEFSAMPQDIEVHGEIISALDDDGAGWTRHTRVYGGGVCLACASSGGEGHGGFYGKNVPPEHRR